MSSPRVRVGGRGFVATALRLALACTVVTIAACRKKQAEAGAEDFQRLSNQGRSLVDAGQFDEAVAAFRKSVELQPTHPDARQNLAVALLRAGDAAGAAAEARELIRLGQNLAAAHFLLGAALLRQGEAEAAIMELQTSKDLEHTVNATSYLLGRAYQELGNLEEAAALYEEVTLFETNHPAAFYNLSQVLTRLDRGEEAAQAMAQHQAILAQRTGPPIDANTLEACIHTEIRVPFQLDQPDPQGIPVVYADGTAEILGGAAKTFAAPFAAIDIHHNGTIDLFARDGPESFRLLINTGGRLEPAPYPAAVPAGAYERVLVGDLNRDRYEDIVLLGAEGLRAFRLATNGMITDSTAFSNLRDLPASDGLLADLDFTGNLDLVLVTPGPRSFQVMRNLGNMYFTNATAAVGLPLELEGIAQVVTDDWNGDELNDVFVAVPGSAPALFLKQRGGGFAPAEVEWPAGHVFAVADFNNDLRNDLVVATADSLVFVLNGFTDRPALALGNDPLRLLHVLDYDNDGWLDLLGIGESGVRAWRNLGSGGFRETTSALGLDRLQGRYRELVSADFDQDGDVDLMLALEDGGLRFLRNDGGHANGLLSLRLLGTRSNASGLGLRIELTSGNWRALRTVHELPVEIGVGRRDRIDSLNVRWFDTMSTDIDTPVEPGRQVALIELVRPTGSCPYLYRWDGEKFSFVTDLLGASPLGLPSGPGRYIAADPDEIVRVGSEEELLPRDGELLLQITEELREVLYLDYARLLVVDHPYGTEVVPTDKLLPGPPFPPSGLVLLRDPIPPERAENLEGRDVTTALRLQDRIMVSPPRLRPPQQRGYSDPHGVVLDFGPAALDPRRPLALVLTGWLHFGGGMANMAASRDPEIPFPFPTLEVEVDGEWRPLEEVAVGAPCGKTKTIVADLDGHLPDGARRLRLTSAFEIHWDRIALMEKHPAGADGMRVTELAPARADLQWRGYSEFMDLPADQPLTPDHARVRPNPYWRINPSGWCTRYGRVEELVAERDGGLALINGGDALTLGFPAENLPPRPEGMQRTYFLLIVGWDKDADFHVLMGDRVEPLPWEGMDDQLYGKQPRPPHPGDELNRRYNTRWVPPMARLRPENPELSEARR